MTSKNSEFRRKKKAHCILPLIKYLHNSHSYFCTHPHSFDVYVNWLLIMPKNQMINQENYLNISVFCCIVEVELLDGEVGVPKWIKHFSIEIEIGYYY